MVNQNDEFVYIKKFGDFFHCGQLAYWEDSEDDPDVAVVVCSKCQKIMEDN